MKEKEYDFNKKRITRVADVIHCMEESMNENQQTDEE